MQEPSASAPAPEIGRCILECREAIIQAWEDQSRRELPEASSAQRDALRNSLPEFLDQLGRTLCEGDGRVPTEYAVEHGIQRWRLGWDVAALARDFMILRRVLVAHARRSVEIDTEDVVAIAAMLDEAVAQSVQAYVTHRELALREQNETLARKNYELKRFAHMVAHEVRNPLGLISLAASTLQRQLGGRPQGEAEAAEPFRLISEGRRQIIEVVDNLVRYASEDDGHPPVSASVELAEVFDDAIDHLKYFIHSSGASVTRGALPAVRGNAVALRSVFQNLIENALKYAGDGPPRVHVSAREEVDGSAGSGGRAYWAIAFRDEGIGISEDDQKRIFRFLSRVNVKAEVPGTGVGLALCRRVAEQHGGAMTVESATGRGSTFTLRLPKG